MKKANQSSLTHKPLIIKFIEFLFFFSSVLKFALLLYTKFFTLPLNKVQLFVKQSCMAECCKI